MSVLAITRLTLEQPGDVRPDIICIEVWEVSGDSSRLWVCMHETK